MRLSAIIPTLNESARIDRAIAAVTGAGADEVLVVDGGSADDTVARASRWPGVRVLHHAPGRAVQLNAGARAATGDVLWFIHADVVPPTAARAHIEATLADEGVVAGAFWTRTVCDTHRRPIAALLPVADLRSRYTRRPYGDQALFVRADAFRSAGGYPEQPLMEDLELSRRLWALGRVRTVPVPVEVSGRRFLARPVYYSVIMNTFPMLYRLGVSPRDLARWYAHVR